MRNPRDMSRQVPERVPVVPRLCAALIALTTSTFAFENTPSFMAKIPAVRLRLGTDLTGVILTTEVCTRARPERPCEPEEFAAELNDGKEQLVPDFLLDRREVSRGDYEQCVRAGQCSPLEDSLLPDSFKSPALPVVNVSQTEAARYCQFRGARLPSEAEFEAAARGSTGRWYPWGNLDNTRRANAGASSQILSSGSDGYSLLAPTSSYRSGRSPQGILQLAGNAAEWTTTRFAPHGTKGRPGLVVVKGGSFAEPRVALRATSRRAEKSASRHPDVGFRCAKSTVFSLSSQHTTDQ